MRQRGFTLVEVMVALAVVAIAVPALLVALYQQIDNTGYLRDRTLAQMVASNKLTEMRLVIAATRNLKKEKADGNLEFADREWFWRSEIEPTEVARFFRLEVQVTDKEDEKAEPLYTLVAFMSADVQTAAQIDRGDVINNFNGGSDNGGTDDSGDDGGSGGGGGSSSGPGFSNGLSPDVQNQLNDAIQNLQ